jgi:putative addiction module component (TIGR02574 family)
MTIAAVKQKLHSYIDQANMDELEAICKLLEGNKGMSIDDETIAELDNRWNNYTSGTSKTYTLEEFSENIKSRRSNTPSQV